MTDFFISYAREDGAFASALVERLEQHYWDAWIDQSDIPPSVLWMNEIQRAIDETMLVVAIASPHWLGSQACQIELELAENARVPIVHIRPDPARVDDAIEQILAAHRTLPPERAVALEAARSAAIWSAAGRRRSLLVRGRPLSVMRKTLIAAPDQFSETAVAFVRASRRASVRRWLLGATIGLVAPTLVLVLVVAPRVVDEVDARVTQSVERLTAYADRNTYAQWNVYSALERASTDADESFASYYQLFDFMNERTPSQWQGTPVNASGPVTATSPDGSRLAVGEGSQVRVTGDGAEVRLPAAATVNALAWSPDGEWIAVATVSGAEVISVGNAQTIALRGGTGTPVSLRWVDDRNVEVGTSTGIGVWPVFDARAVAHPSGVRYGASVGDIQYTVNAAGVVTATDTVTGAVQEWDAAVPEGAMPTAMDAAGPLVAVAYGGDRPFLRVRDTSAGGDPVDIPLSDCSPTALSVASSGADAYLVCAQAEINQTRVSLSDGSLSSQPMPEQYLYGVRALDDRVLWGGSYGAVFESGTDLTQHGRVPIATGCGAPTRRFAGASDGRRLFPAGDGTGSASCAVRMETGDGGIETDRLIFHASDGFAVPDAEVSADGSLVAYGLSDGRVRVFRTDDLSPVYFAQVMGDQVRDVFFSADDTRLIVSGASGKTVAIPMPHVSQSDAGAALVEAARVRLQQAIDSGLYVSTVGEG